MDRIKLLSGFTLGRILLLLLILQGGILYGQDVTISQLTGGIAASPLVAGATDQAILGIEFSKAAGGTNELESIVIALTEDPAGRFTNVRLCRSDNNNSFDGADLANTVGTVAVGSSPDEITISGTITTFGGNASAQVRRYFLVVDINPAVTGATANIQASLDPTDVTLGNDDVLGTTVTGTNYAFAAATITINQLTGGIAPDPLGSATTNQAVLGFSLTSNSNPDFTSITIHTTSAASGKLTNIRLFSSADNSFGGDASIATASSVTASTIVFTGLSEGLSGSASYFFVVANIEPTVNASTPQIELSFDEGDVVATAGTVQPATITGTDYSFADVAPPSITARTPADNATGIAVSTNTLQITFDENVVYVGDNSDPDNMIRIRDLDASAFIATIAVSDVSVSGNVVTLTFSAPLTPNTDYAIRIGNSVFEDGEGNVYAGITNDTSWNFETEFGPDITSYSADPTCVGETITINGTGFGLATPTVTVNGVTATVNSHTSTTISIVVPNTTSGLVVVTNNTNTLSGNDNTLTLKPAIAASLPLTANPSSPAVDQDYDIEVANTQMNVNYAIRELPGGFGSTTAGTGGTISFGVYNQNSDGTYQYEVRATSAGCTQRTYGPLSVVIAALSVDAGTSTAICEGESTTLGGAPTASGGTAYYNISWSTVPPSGFSSTASNPTVSPTNTTTYRVSLKDTPSGTPITDDITITVNPVSTLSFVDTLRTSFSTSDTLYLLSDKVIITPSDGTGDFSGLGIVKIPNNASGKYYFNPQSFSLPTSGIPINYTHTAANGCVSTIQTTFSIYNTNVLLTNIDNLVCSNEEPISNIFVNTSFYTPPAGKKIGAIKVYHPAFGYAPIFPSNPNYPLTLTSTHPTNGPIYTYNPQKALAYLNYGGNQYNYIYLDVFLADAVSGVVDLYYSTYQFVQVFAPGPKPDILPFTELQPVCETGSVVDLSSSLERAGYTTINFDDNSGISALITKVGSNYEFDPDAITFPGTPTTRTVQIQHIYTDRSGCQDTTYRRVVMIEQIGPPTPSDAEYCQGTPDRELTLIAKTNTIGSTDVLWYSDAALTTFVGKGETFLTGLSGSSPQTKDFYATQLYNTCESTSTAVTIEIKEAPNADFTPPSICVDRPFTLTGPADNDPDYDIATYEWDFGDGDSTATGQTVNYQYGAVNQYKISLRVTSTENCEAEEIRNIVVGLNPKPVFSFDQICNGDNTHFVGNTDIAVQQYEWDFGDGLVIGPGNSLAAAPGGGTFKSPLHIFAGGIGEYNVRVRAITSTGCFDTLVRKVNILPVLPYTSTNPYYMAALDGGKGFWLEESIKGDSVTWEFGSKQDTVFNFSESAWVTNKDGNYFPNTISTLISPCFNITAIDRPVISFNMLANIEQGDGAALQYSTDGGSSWNNLGTIGSGKNWFNEFGLAFGGGNNQGWSGNLWEGDTTWIEARRILDDITPRNKIRFRMAFISGQEVEGEGFVFKDLSIESRNRLMLVENFTNAAAPGAVANNNAFYALPSIERVKLEYHTSFPSGDPLNEDSPMDQNARAAYYGLTNGNGIIPRVYVDGDSEGDLTPPSTWFTTKSVFRALEASPIEITITSPPAVPGIVSVQAAVKVNRATPGKKIVHVVLVEKTVGVNQFVVRKFLPDAAGTTMPANVLSLPDSTFNLAQSWQVSRIDDANELAIVVFVQEETSREVLQAQYLESPAFVPSTVTGAEAAFEEQIVIFPNPVEGQLNIKLPKKYSQSLPVSLIDGFGREVHTSSFKPGEAQKIIYTTDFAAGVYVLQIRSDTGEIARKKIVVVN